MWTMFSQSEPTIGATVEILWSNGKTEVNIWRGTQITIRGTSTPIKWRYV
jgi:hypothetical protein